MVSKVVEELVPALVVILILEEAIPTLVPILVLVQDLVLILRTF